MDARVDPDFVIIARTDAIAVNGFDDAVERAQSYAEAGADVLFVEAPIDDVQVRRLPELIRAPLLYSWFLSGPSPPASVDTLRSVGYRFVLMTDVLHAVTHLLRRFYGELKRTGTYESFRPDMLSFDEFNEILGLGRALELDERHGGSA